MMTKPFRRTQRLLLGGVGLALTMLLHPGIAWANLARPSRGGQIAAEPVGIKDVAFSPDGKRMLTGNLDKTARLWQVPTAIGCDPRRITLWTQVLTGMELDQQGAPLALAAETWQKRRKELEKLGGPPAEQ
jgi:hypothetical protein